jgi:hypothetical protein
MKKISRHELMQYGTAVISFLIVMTFTLLIFFWFVQQSVDKSVQNVIQKNTLQQKDHLELVLEKEYEFLESPAAYFGTTSDLFSSDNLQLLAELASSSFFLQTVSDTPAMERIPMQVHGTIFKRHWKADASLVLLCQVA